MGVSRGAVITIVVAALVVAGLTYLLPAIWVLAIVLVPLVVLAVLLLLASKTGFGRRGAAVVGRRLARTRVGHRLTHAQLRAEARRKGIPTTDPLGRELSDVELQLELLDTPETRQIKRQLRGMNPQQRAQALRMLEAQAEQAQRTGVAPTAPPQAARGGISGRPVTRPPRASRKRRRR
jgi:hypothetical protein